MTFTVGYSEELTKTLQKIRKKNKNLVKATLDKMEEIASRDEISIQYYKNLSHGLSEFKRVHVSKSFVLLFRLDKKHNQIRFEALKHHDDAYK